MIPRIVTAITVLLALGCAAQAQQRPLLPPQKSLPPEKYSPRPVLPTRSTPWVKVCDTDSQRPPTDRICLTMKEVRLDNGEFVAAAALIDQPKMLLRVSLPAKLRKWASVRVLVGEDTPRSDDNVTCSGDRCIANFAIDQDFVARLKGAPHLALEGTDALGQVARYLLPLGDFATAFDGPPSDPDAFKAR